MQINKTALITGASKGFGFQLAQSLAQLGWNLLITARSPVPLLAAKRQLSDHTNVMAVAGDVRDEIHLMELAEILAANHWQIDLLVNNASALGDTPLPKLLDHSVEQLHTVLHTNMIAPITPKPQNPKTPQNF